MTLAFTDGENDTCGGAFPPRPGSGALSESIPLFFIGRNSIGFWVVREAQGRIGGLFFCKRSALHFAASNSAPAGCGTMVLNERLELDLKNQGNPLAAVLVRTASRLSRLIPKYPPRLAIGQQKLEKGGWR